MPEQFNDNSENMTFWEHLDVLRMSLFRILIIIGIIFIGCVIAMPYIFDSVILGATKSDFILYKLLSSLGNLPFMPDFSDNNFNAEIININITSQFFTHLSSALMLSAIISVPYILFEVWRFVRPALYDNEMKSAKVVFLGGSILFYIGCAVGYMIVFPLTFRFLADYRLGNIITNQINLSSYMDIFYTMIIIMGLTFELPVVVWLLSKTGLINKGFLKKYRRHAIVILMTAAAIITPTGDPFTLIIVFVPLYILYEFSISIVRK